MNFLHCKIQFGNAGVLDNFNSVVSPSPGIDFVTGDIAILSPPPWTWALLPGSTVGVPTTVANIATDTIIIVSDTSAMSVNEKVGIELDAGYWFWTRINTVDSGVGITIDDGLPSSVAIGNRVAVVSQLDGLTDFTIQHDFKLEKATRVLNKTERLLDRGVNHNGRKFPANERIVSILAAADISNLAGPTFYVFDKDMLPYDIINAGDFRGLKDAIATRIRSVYNNTTGQSSLITAIVNADNTLIAMNAIIDSR